MIRRIIQIDEGKCNGCGACADACHEGAIGMVDGVAKLLRDDYCDGLGDCLPTCPTGAITFVEREADAYDEAAVQANMEARKAQSKAPFNVQGEALPCGCPGSQSRAIHRDAPAASTAPVAPVAAGPAPAELGNWPVQIKLAPVNAPYFDGAKLLVAADCTAYAYGNFHRDFIKDKVTLIGCPKLDMVDYAEKLTAIIAQNDIKSLTVVRMEVPCCGGIENAVKQALQNSGKMIPWQVVVIGTDGRILDR
ncbi:ATP-binding protein [Eubacterium barkeri]|uniref:4Fe-4S binding domain-containing protein n=1 Tax=Eubacterium barkeri TaxID=1528 RepID=A0A1H3HKW6_EUBBA|nr:4Fe-4S binding protein [Eubacterium barkeri]SDY16173.1 4Fe-4S binding domain-containing protein [Eubacterium barkeri]